LSLSLSLNAVFVFNDASDVFSVLSFVLSFNVFVFVFADNCL
jgi:hypothetical protein